MKKNILLIIIILFLSACVFGRQNKKVVINFDYDKKFPSSKYLISKASGKTEQDAILYAKSEMANVFESKINSNLYSYTKSTSSLDDESFSKTVKNDIKLFSSVKIQGVEIGETFFDEKTNLFYALIILDKKKSQNIWNLKIKEIDAKIKALLNVSKTSNSKIIKLIKLQKAYKLWIERGAITTRLEIISRPYHINNSFDMEKVFNEMAFLKNSIHIFIEAKNNNSISLKKYLASFFSSKNFILTDDKKKADVIVFGKINFTEVKIKRDDGIKFSRAKIFLSVLDSNKNRIFEFIEKSRAGHKNYDEAKFQAFKKCTKKMSNKIFNW